MVMDSNVRVRMDRRKMAGPAREECTTQKIESAHGSHYIHVHHVRGRVTGISISSPGKYGDTALGALLIEIGDAASSVIADITKGAN
jgi:hypothetical protein